MTNMRSALPVGLALAALAFASGCGSSSDKSSSDQLARGSIDELYGTAGFDPPPTEAPRPQPGKKIVAISCGQTIGFCSRAVNSAAAAARSIGWQASVVDTAGDPAKASQAIDQAVASGADGLFVEGWDCPYIKEALTRAHKAGVKVVASESRDCDRNLSGDPTAGPKLFDGELTYKQGNVEDWMDAYGTMQAQALAGLTKNKVNVLYFHFSDLMASIRSARANHAFYDKHCPKTCKLTDVTFTVAEASKSLQQKAQQALLKHPDANAVQVDTDSVLLNGVLSAVQKSGRKILIMSGEGDTPIMDLARRKDDNLYGIGLNTSWEGYGGVDVLNRLFNGKDPVPTGGAQGPGIQIWGPGHNISPSGPYVSPIDFAAGFKKAWGG